MSGHALFDTSELLDDLRLSVRYASRLGLLSSNREILRTLSEAEAALASGRELNIAELSSAVSDVAKIISPITLSDLRDGRDPSSPANQVKARRMQLLLTAFALLVLVVIGYFMHALHQEQDVIKTLGEIQALQPQQKLTTVRRLAQEENPISNSPTLYAEYRQRVQELLSLNSRLQLTYMEAVSASQLPLFPLGNVFASSITGRAVAASPPPAAPAAYQPASEPAPGPTSHPARDDGVSRSSDGVDAGVAPSPGTPVKPGDTCVEETDGSVHLPDTAKRYPVWMKRILLDALNDFCFQVKVLSPYGDSGLLDQSLAQLSFLPGIKEKVSLRVEWFLPFLYGILGSSIFLMRNITNPRVPTLEWFPILVRVSLGGVAAIVMGWFSSPANSSSLPATALSFPLALSFLTGYGIEVVFDLLDRLNHALAASGTKS